MAKTLSFDLRQRVVEAVGNGMSRRQAAFRFGVSASSAVRWTARAAAGELAARRRGGDHRSGRIEAHATFILAEIGRRPDMTLAELQSRLAKAQRAHFGIGTLWRFFARRGITYKKRRRGRPNRIGRTS